ncbi:MAG: hypothetical protein QGH39_05595 [Candidatus Thermoplasmatota archaeon]|jgi:hypothetical protein|nr:hypothetical protein [Candidatus Thermoplasmatota archaeon]MDP7265018.1 hypothetical protein [Candidatus Thermoplasmatota archaeon]
MRKYTKRGAGLYFKRNKGAFVEIGYIYVLVISALVFVSLTTMISQRVEEETDRSAKVQLYEIGGKIEMNINNAVIFAASHPDSQLDMNVMIPTTVGGDDYTVYIKDNEMFLNSSGTVSSVKFYLMESPYEVLSYNARTGTPEPIQSSYGSINLKYGKGLNNNVIWITENTD